MGSGVGVNLCPLESNLGPGQIGLKWGLVYCRCISLHAGIESGTRENRVRNGSGVGVNLCPLESNLGPGQIRL